MLDFPELFAPARMVSGRISIDWRRAIDLYPHTLIWVKPSEFGNPLAFLEFGRWFILDHLYKNLYVESTRKMPVYNAASPCNRKNCAKPKQGLPVSSLRVGGAYVSTFFVGTYAPLASLRPLSPSHGTPSIASSEASRRK